MRSLSIYTGYLLLLVGLYSACSISPGFSETPSISNIGISKDTMEQGSLLSDSIFLSFSFRDGDGDLGTEAGNLFENIILTDLRTNETYGSYNIPSLNLNGAMTGIEGVITVKVFNTCCRFPDNIPPCEAPPQFPTNELQLELVLQDDSGKRSNAITSPVITLLCNG